MGTPERTWSISLDSDEAIHNCLNCPYPECVNCYERTSNSAVLKYISTVKEYWLKGFTDLEIATLMKLELRTVKRYRGSLLKLPANK